MNKIFAFAAAVPTCAIQNVNADLIELPMTARSRTPAEINGGAPEGRAFEFFTTTDDDILAINFTSTIAFGSENQFRANNEPPLAALIPVFPRSFC